MTFPETVCILAFEELTVNGRPYQWPDPNEHPGFAFSP